MPTKWHSLYASPTEPLLEWVYEELMALIQRAHINSMMRMNALEYVHDVCGEYEREAVNSVEDRTSTASRDSPLSPHSWHTSGNLPSPASLSQVSTRRQQGGG